MARKTLDASATAEVVQSLFQHGVQGPTEAAARLKGVDKPTARRLAVARLARGALQAFELETLASLFGALGLGEEREELRRAVLSPSLADEVRNCALRCVIAGRDLDLLSELSQQIAPEQADALARSSWAEIVAQAEAGDAGAELVASLLKESSEETRARMLQGIEAARREAGARAAVLYRKALGKASLGSSRQAMLEAIVEEADPGAVALIQRCFEAAQRDDFRRELQAGLMRLRTREASPTPAPRASPAGHAMLGACDGQGAVLILACFAGSGGRQTVASVCVRLSEDVRDGFLIPRQTAEEVRQIVAEMSAGAHTRFVRTDLGRAAALVAEAAERTRAMGRTIPEEVRPAIARIGAVEPAAPEPFPAPAESTSIEEVRALLARRELARSWFFDQGDLDGAGLGPPRDGSDWVSEYARKLDAPKNPRPGGRDGGVHGPLVRLGRRRAGCLRLPRALGGGWARLRGQPARSRHAREVEGDERAHGEPRGGGRRARRRSGAPR